MDFISMNSTREHFISPFHLTVIIPCWRSEELLPRALDSLARQRIDPYKMEVVVVFDEAKGIYDGISPGDYPFNIRLNHCPSRLGTYAARRIGFDDTSGRYVFHLDSDDEVADCLKVLLDKMPTDIISMIPDTGFSCYGGACVRKLSEIGKSGYWAGSPLALSLLSRSILTRAYTLLDQVIDKNEFLVCNEDILLFHACCCAMEGGRHWLSDGSMGRIHYNRDNPNSMRVLLTREDRLEGAKKLKEWSRKVSTLSKKRL